MKRSSYLRDLSSDHHQSLTLARKILKEFSLNHNMEPLIAQTRKEFQENIVPHFEKEEQTVLQELEKLGETAMVKRTLEDHQLLTYLSEHLEEPGTMLEFAAALQIHVRFEERELFQTMQRIWDRDDIK